MEILSMRRGVDSVSQTANSPGTSMMRFIGEILRAISPLYAQASGRWTLALEANVKSIQRTCGEISANLTPKLQSLFP
jgi:hypothetical protein